MRRAIGVALTLLSLAIGAMGQAGAAPLGQVGAATGVVWLQNHAEVTLWSASDAETAQAFATVPEFLGFFRVEAPVRRARGRIFVYYPGDTSGVQPGHVWVSERALGPAAAPPPPGLLFRPPLPVMTIEDIFLAVPEPIGGPNAARIRTLIATGDVIPARNVDSIIRARGNDFLYPVAETADVLRAADLTLINLEAPLIPYCPHHPGGGFQFCGQSGFVEALVHAGVDVASLENNHIGNYGPDGIAATVELLHAHGIDHADPRTLALRDVQGLRYGFLAFNGNGERIDSALIAATIGKALERVGMDVVGCD